jgi:hypothetical protein
MAICVRKVILVCDNLNTHTKGEFSETSKPTRARQLVRRIEICHTPKRGSWLYFAEDELSSVPRQRLAAIDSATGERCAVTSPPGPRPTTQLNAASIGK